MNFWDHLDILRSVILKILAVTLVFSLIAFVFKDTLFTIVLAPKNADFITYQWLNLVGDLLPGGEMANFNVALINTGLAEQFIIHMKTAFCAGILCASPYILYQMFRFVSPALYENEKSYAVKSIGWGYLMFLIGVGVSYYLVFPLTFRFLGTYQVSHEVANMISLQSYMSTLILMSLAMGIVFEMPVLAWLFAKMGFISTTYLRKYRKHAIVIILIAAAIITPTSDVFTLIVVSLPMYLLYELSITIVKRVSKNNAADENLCAEA